MSLTVLLYHHVGPDRRGLPPDLTVAPAAFEAQMQLLVARRYCPIRASEVLALRRKARAFPRRSVLVTFDDAYADTTAYALPILGRYGLSGIVFTVTSLIGGSNAWDQGAGLPSVGLMSISEIGQWANRGIEFGAHTRTHRDLTTLSESELEREVGGSAADLKEILGTKPRWFAYPYGRRNRRVRVEVARHFDAAATISAGFNDERTDLYGVKRISIAGYHTIADLACKLRLGRSVFSPFSRVSDHFRCGAS